MARHPHGKPNFRNLFWYPFKITGLTVLRTYEFIGKRFSSGYHNTTHPEFIDEGDIVRAEKTKHINDITAHHYTPDRAGTEVYGNNRRKNCSIEAALALRWSFHIAPGSGIPPRARCYRYSTCETKVDAAYCTYDRCCHLVIHGPRDEYEPVSTDCTRELPAFSNRKVSFRST